jgi:hypothetical protein
VEIGSTDLKTVVIVAVMKVLVMWKLGSEKVPIEQELG